METLFEKPNLKEVHLCGSHSIDGYPKAALENLDNFRKENDKRFEIFVFGFYYEYFKSFPEMQKQWFDNDLTKTLNFFIQNLPLMAETVYSFYEVDYCKLENLGNEELDSFLRKFKNIRTVLVEGCVKDEKRLLDFLSKTKPIIKPIISFLIST